MFRRFSARGSWLLAVVLLLASPTPVLAKSEVNKSFLGGIAISGVDAVAYFTDAKAVIGSSKFSHQWKGAEWRFKNATNRDAFAKTPEKYAPAFGGYCAWAVSQGYTAGIDPEAWTIHEGTLYLNYSKNIQKQWVQDISGNIAKGRRNWPGVLE